MMQRPRITRTMIKNYLKFPKRRQYCWLPEYILVNRTLHMFYRALFGGYWWISSLQISWELCLYSMWCRCWILMGSSLEISEQATVAKISIDSSINWISISFQKSQHSASSATMFADLIIVVSISTLIFMGTRQKKIYSAMDLSIYPQRSTSSSQELWQRSLRRWVLSSAIENPSLPSVNLRKILEERTCSEISKYPWHLLSRFPMDCTKIKKRRT